MSTNRTRKFVTPSATKMKRHRRGELCSPRRSRTPKNVGFIGLQQSFYFTRPLDAASTLYRPQSFICRIWRMTSWTSFSFTSAPYLSWLFAGTGKMNRTQSKQKRHGVKPCLFVCVGTYLFYRAASSQVSSARVSLTAVFGMGTGVPSPSSAPTISQGFYTLAGVGKNNLLFFH